MRRYRRIRTGYRPGAKKKPIKAIVIRALFVILSAAALTFAAVLLGNHLKDKASNAEKVLSSSQPAISLPPQGAEVFPDGVHSVSDTNTIAVCAAYIDIASLDSDEITDTLVDLHELYNTVSVDIFDENRQLRYLSKALMNYVGLNTDAISSGSVSQRLDSEESDETTSVTVNTNENIATLVRQCDAKSLRLSGIFKADVSVLDNTSDAYVKKDIDSVILGELYSMGFDEVIITGLVEDEETMDHNKLKSIVSYLAHLRKNSSELDIGLLLPASVYLTPQSAGIIKTLSEYVDFLAMSVDTEAEDQDEAYYTVFDEYHSLKGNFSVYNIRGVIVSRNPGIASAINSALRDLSVVSTQFSVFTNSPGYVPDQQISTELPVESEPIFNDNASRKENYEFAENAEDTSTNE